MIASQTEAVTKNQTTMELKGDREILITRQFNGPARIVFDAWTRADLVRRWWAPKSHGVVMKSCEADVRVGGRYRYVIHHAEGGDLAFSGVYTEVTPHSRLVYTHVFEPMADAGEAIVTITFEERAGKTLLTSIESYPSAQVRQNVIDSGMESGMRETLDQLDELVATLR